MLKKGIQPSEPIPAVFPNKEPRNGFNFLAFPNRETAIWHSDNRWSVILQTVSTVELQPIYWFGYRYSIDGIVIDSQE